VALRGETLKSIARHYGVRVEDLRRWNGLRKRDRIRRWRRLWVHVPIAAPGLAMRWARPRL